MDINDLLKKVKFNNNELLDYGFIKEDNNYKYSKMIMNNEFRVDVIISNNKLSSKVIDNSVNEEYYSVFVKDNKGEYVGRVREEYYNVIKDIVDKCSSKEYFIYKQTNRICKYIIIKYFAKPEFLWDSSPDCGVFRHKDNNKWFGIIMNIDKYKLDGINHKDIEVINIKIDQNNLDELLKINGIYRAYHMNKKMWVSIILDDTLDDKDIINLIDKSFINTK